MTVPVLRKAPNGWVQPRCGAPAEPRQLQSPMPPYGIPSLEKPAYFERYDKLGRRFLRMPWLGGKPVVDSDGDYPFRHK